MNKRSILNRSALTLGIALAMSGSAIGVFADGTTYTPVDGSQIQISKYLVMDKEANVPNVGFDYTVTAPEAINSDGETTLKVFSGTDAAATNGVLPTVVKAANTKGDKAEHAVNFAQGDTTYDSIQAQDNDTIRNKTNGTDTDNDAVTDFDPSTQKYARHNFTLDFSGVQFKEPGVYRYVITEDVIGQSYADKGITAEEDHTRTLDVYVEDKDGALQITGYVLFNENGNDGTATVLADGTNPTEKSDGFTNFYETENLALKKTVSGNQASHDEYFKFTVKITDALPDTQYDVAGNFDQTTKTNGINTEAHTNPTTLTTDADGSVTQDFWLQQGQSIKIQGLAKNTAYSINEDATTIDNEGYTPSLASVLDDDFTADTTGDSKNGDGDEAAAVALDAKSYTISDSKITADTGITINNEKSGTVPTGIIMSVLPGALAVIGAGAATSGIVVGMNRKKHEEEDE